MNFQSVDCPLVFQIAGDKAWHMFYTGYNGTGYQTMQAKSTNLTDWESSNLVMSYGKKGAFDHGGVTFGGALFETYGLKDARILKQREGTYWVLYGCYLNQGGYEIRPGAQGAAISEDGFHWDRLSDSLPILSIEGAEVWEEDCIYQPWLVEHETKYYNFYNAANKNFEQMGLAVSDDLIRWHRYPHNPVIPNGSQHSFDEIFCADGKVFYDEDHWVMFYFGVSDVSDRRSAHIMAAYSLDLVHWTKDPEPLYKAGGHPFGLDEHYAHKISIVYHPENDTFYMYYCAVGNKGRGIGLITSKLI
ncbi:MAG TPA: hypothetical protein VGE40_03295 [Bacilli bacterium]